MQATLEEPRCPQCGEPVPLTITTSESGDQLTPEQIECTGCGALLERAVEGHSDHGWRLVQRPADDA
jgi:hypothetical protein